MNRLITVIAILFLVMVFESPSFAGRSVSNLETCFSPDENCDLKLISLIDSTETALDIAIYSITHKNITAAIIAAKDRGVKVRMVVDKSEAKGTGSSVPSLIQGGINVEFGNVRGIMHD